MKRTLIAAALAMIPALAPVQAQAAASINLAGYSLTGNFALDTLSDMGLEASAVTYAKDRNSLFFVGDEGMGVVEISKTGATLGTMAFNWAGTGSTNNDAEGLTYLGNGKLVVVDERPQIAYQFDFVNGGTVVLNNQPKVAITGNYVGDENHVLVRHYLTEAGDQVAVRQLDELARHAGQDRGSGS